MRSCCGDWSSGRTNGHVMRARRQANNRCLHCTDVAENAAPSSACRGFRSLLHQRTENESGGSHEDEAAAVANCACLTFFFDTRPPRPSLDSNYSTHDDDAFQPCSALAGSRWRGRFTGQARDRKTRGGLLLLFIAGEDVALPWRGKSRPDPSRHRVKSTAAAAAAALR